MPIYFHPFGVKCCSHVVQMHLFSYSSVAILVSHVLRGLKFLCAKSLALLSPLPFMLLLPCFFTVVHVHEQICCPLEYC